MRLFLTDRFVSGAKPGSYFDEQVTGLALRAFKSGKTWSFAFTLPDGRRTQMKIGSYPSVSLAAARTLGIEARGYVEAGRDPRTAFGAARAASSITVAMQIDSYLADPEKAKLRGLRAIRRRLYRNIVPIIGTVALGSLHRRDIQRALDPILRRGCSSEARRVFEDMRAVVRWSLARGDIEADVMAAMVKPVGSPPRTRVLSPEEIVTLWNNLPTALPKDTATQNVIRLCLLTGQRVGEVSGIELSEIDFKTATWMIPARRSKNKHAHTVPLTDLALDIVKSAIADVGPNAHFLFPDGDSASVTARNFGKRVIRARNRFGVASFSPHDLRRTALTGMAEIGVLPHVISWVANHRSGTHAGVTANVYIKHTYDAEKRTALDLWSDRVRALVSGKPAAKVIPLTGSVVR
jgi:integrase